MGTLRAEENPQTGEEEYYNSVLAMDKATPGVGWHDKHHLVPFVEFFPVPQFVRNWLRLMTLPYSDFNRGAAQQAPLDAAGQRIAASVCYEDAYGATLLPVMRHRDDAGQRHQRLLVRSFDGALPASADQPPARHGDRPPDGAGRQRRRFGGHRSAGRDWSPRRRNMKQT